ncbi:hypothetical protein [Phenylobacterium sp. SCN 70-31]|uniref:hypothetical protein n=1 Tax=Phenylobacterium sp. SCN 70-31 TaxID=1660129 RepID=UPI0025E37FEB|nr:hypothetical protein [Phenylobacterium sp. SCN 70-31]
MKIKLLGRLALARLLAGMIAALLASPSLAIPPPPVPAAPAGAATYSPEQLANTQSVELARELFSDWARGLVEKRLDEGPAFYTKPRASYAGVCVVTRVRFGMGVPTGSGGDRRAYVQGVDIEQLYHLVDLPGPFDPTHVSQGNTTISLCNKLATGIKYFPAPSGLVAAYQHHLIDDAIAQAKGTGGLNFKLDCLRGAGSDCRARQVLAKLDASDIKSIKSRDCAGYSRNECYEIAVSDWTVEVESRLSTYGYSLVEPDRILVSIGLSKLPHDMVVNCADCR